MAHYFYPHLLSRLAEPEELLQFNGIPWASAPRHTPPQVQAHLEGNACLHAFSNWHKKYNKSRRRLQMREEKKKEAIQREEGDSYSAWRKLLRWTDVFMAQDMQGEGANMSLNLSSITNLSNSKLTPCSFPFRTWYKDTLIKHIGLIHSSLYFTSLNKYKWGQSNKHRLRVNNPYSFICLLLNLLFFHFFSRFH